MYFPSGDQVIAPISPFARKLTGCDSPPAALTTRTFRKDRLSSAVYATHWLSGDQASDAPGRSPVANTRSATAAPACVGTVSKWSSLSFLRYATLFPSGAHFGSLSSFPDCVRMVGFSVSKSYITRLCPLLSPDPASER